MVNESKSRKTERKNEFNTPVSFVPISKVSKDTFGTQKYIPLLQSGPYMIYLENSLADMNKGEKSSKLLYIGERCSEGMRVKGLKACACRL